MATIFECDFNDTDFPQGGSHPAGVAWDRGIDGTSPSGAGLSPLVGTLATGGSHGPASGGEYALITSAASRRSGYKGFRFWIEGTNGGAYSFAPEATNAGTHDELWFRWYMRTAATWTLGRPGYWKLWRQNDPNGIIIGNGYPTGGDWGININSPDDATNYGDPAEVGGDAVWSDTNDGAWHCYEFHIKNSSTSPGNDGVFQFWLDGVLKTNASNVSYAGASNVWGAFYVDNQSEVTNGPVAVDVTDMKMVDSGGPIGTLSAGGGTSKGITFSYFR